MKRIRPSWFRDRTPGQIARNRSRLVRQYSRTAFIRYEMRRRLMGRLYSRITYPTTMTPTPPVYLIFKDDR